MGKPQSKQNTENSENTQIGLHNEITENHTNIEVSVGVISWLLGIIVVIAILVALCAFSRYCVKSFNKKVERVADSRLERLRKLETV